MTSLPAIPPAVPPASGASSSSSAAVAARGAIHNSPFARTLKEESSKVGRKPGLSKVADGTASDVNSGASVPATGKSLPSVAAAAVPVPFATAGLAVSISTAAGIPADGDCAGDDSKAPALVGRAERAGFASVELVGGAGSPAATREDANDFGGTLRSDSRDASIASAEYVAAGAVEKTTVVAIAVAKPDALRSEAADGAPDASLSRSAVAASLAASPQASGKAIGKSSTEELRLTEPPNSNAGPGSFSPDLDAPDGASPSDGIFAQQAIAPSSDGDADNATDVSALFVPAGMEDSRTNSRGPLQTESEDDTDGRSAAPVASVEAATGLEVASIASAHSSDVTAGSLSQPNLSPPINDKHGRGIDTLTVLVPDGDIAGAALQSAGAAAAGGTSTGFNAGTTMPLQMHAAVGSAGFQQDLSEKVAWMVGNGLDSAKLQVNPPQLGPIELSISVQGDHAQVAMITHSTVTRDALESSAPTLKDMLASQGFGQVSVDISQRSFQERSAYTPHPYERSAVSRTDTSTGPASASSTTVGATRLASGVLDAYA